MIPQQLGIELQTITTFAGLCRLIHGVQGFLLPSEGYLLARLAAIPQPAGDVVEIGSFKGHSTCWLAAGMRMVNAPGKVYAVDHFKGSAEHQQGQQFADPDLAKSGSTRAVFDANIASRGLSQLVEAIEMPSAEAAAEWARRGGTPIRLLFIDGDHDYEATKLDFNLWSPFVPIGGLVAFHDVNSWEGVTKFVGELTAAKTTFKGRIAMDSVRVFERIAAG